MSEPKLLETAAQTPDLDLAVKTLISKTERNRKRWLYFDGPQPLKYSTERMREVFDKITARFSLNLCEPIVQAVMDRICLEALQVEGNDGATKRIKELLDANELAICGDDAHRAAIVTGESYIVAWKDPGADIEAYYHDPSNVHLFYESDRPRVKRFGCKWWREDDDHLSITLYYPDRLEYFRSTKKAEQVQNGKDFEVSEEAGKNPYGVVPVFRFVRDTRRVKGECEAIEEIQDAVNKLLNDMMIAAEFSAARQRWVISHSDSDLTSIQQNPYSPWFLPAADGEAQDTSVGEFETTELANFSQSIDSLTTYAAFITRTPKHYFAKEGGDPSGEALLTMESPLVKKVQGYLDRFGSTWRDLGAFLLLLDGTAVERSTLSPVWEQAQASLPLTEAQVRQADVSTGIPLEIVLEDEGWPPEKIARVTQIKAEEQKRQQEMRADLAMRAFNGGGSLRQ